MPDPIYIAFGANLGDPIESFRKALKILEKNGVTILSMSGLWQSPSWPTGMGAPNYINACARVEYAGEARELLAILHHTEADLGRERSTLNAPRTLDLDLLDFRGIVIKDKDIQLPHPRMMGRGFVLFPMSQIAKNWHHPLTGEGIEIAISKLAFDDVKPITYLGRQDFSTSH